MPTPQQFTLFFLIALIISPNASAGEPRPVRFGVEAGGGFAGLELEDFAKAAKDNAGTAESAGWTGGGRAIIQLAMGLGLSAGWVAEGGGRYENTITGYNNKKSTSLTRTIMATFDQTVYPISLHYRRSFDRIELGGELGIDVTTATVHYTESNSQGDSLRGDLQGHGIGTHVAGDVSVRLGGGISAYLRIGYSILSLNAFSGTVDENGTLKPESLFMVKESGSDREQLEVSTSNSLTSSDHRPAKVSGAGIRIAGGLRWLF